MADHPWQIDVLDLEAYLTRVGVSAREPSPTTHFRHGLMLTKHGPDHHTAVTHETVTIRRPGQPTEHRDLREGELEQLLDELALPLTPDEETQLLEVVAGFSPPG